MADSCFVVQCGWNGTQIDPKNNAKPGTACIQVPQRHLIGRMGGMWAMRHVAPWARFGQLWPASQPYFDDAVTAGQSKGTEDLEMGFTEVTTPV